MRVLSLRQHCLRSVPLVHFETAMERSSQRGTRTTVLTGPTAEGSVAVTRQVTVVPLLVIAVTHCIIAPKDLFSE